MSKIKRFRIHQSIYNTYSLPAKRTPTTTHTHHTVHRTSVGSITSITSITNTTITTTRTHARAHPHTDDSTSSSSIITTSQHRSVPINNKYIRHVQFTFHSRPYNHPAIHVFALIPSFACHTTTYIIQTNNIKQKHNTEGLADFL